MRIDWIYRNIHALKKDDMMSMLRDWAKRPLELFSKFDEGVETVMTLAIMWQTQYMCTVTWGNITVEPKSIMGSAAYQIAIDARTLWSHAFYLPLLCILLIICSALSFLGLMNKNEPMRLMGAIISTAWWLLSATILIINSPMHSIGGLNAVLGMSGILIYAHRFVVLDRQNELQIIDKIAKMAGTIRRVLTPGKTQRR